MKSAASSLDADSVTSIAVPVGVVRGDVQARRARIQRCQDYSAWLSGLRAPTARGWLRAGDGPGAEVAQEVLHGIFELSAFDLAQHDVPRISSLGPELRVVSFKSQGRMSVTRNMKLGTRNRIAHRSTSEST